MATSYWTYSPSKQVGRGTYSPETWTNNFTGEVSSTAPADPTAAPVFTDPQAYANAVLKNAQLVYPGSGRQQSPYFAADVATLPPTDTLAANLAKWNAMDPTIDPAWAAKFSAINNYDTSGGFAPGKATPQEMSGVFNQWTKDNTPSELTNVLTTIGQGILAVSVGAATMGALGLGEVVAPEVAAISSGTDAAWMGEIGAGGLTGTEAAAAAETVGAGAATEAAAVAPAAAVDTSIAAAPIASTEGAVVAPASTGGIIGDAGAATGATTSTFDTALQQAGVNAAKNAAIQAVTTGNVDLKGVAGAALSGGLGSLVNTASIVGDTAAPIVNAGAKGAISGGISAAVTGGDVGFGAVLGAATGAAGAGAKMLIGVDNSLPATEIPAEQPIPTVDLTAQQDAGTLPAPDVMTDNGYGGIINTVQNTVAPIATETPVPTETPAPIETPAAIVETPPTVTETPAPVETQPPIAETLAPPNELPVTTSGGFADALPADTVAPSDTATAIPETPAVSTVDLTPQQDAGTLPAPPISTELGGGIINAVQGTTEPTPTIEQPAAEPLPVETPAPTDALPVTTLPETPVVQPIDLTAQQDTGTLPAPVSTDTTGFTPYLTSNAISNGFAGAVSGAVGAAITGNDILNGALTGGIAGGVTGYGIDNGMNSTMAGILGTAAGSLASTALPGNNTPAITAASTTTTTPAPTVVPQSLGFSAALPNIFIPNDRNVDFSTPRMNWAGQ